MSRLPSELLGTGFSPRVARSTGEGNIDWTFKPANGGPFKLLFVRVHFRDSSGIGDLSIYLDSSGGEEYDAKLYTHRDRGIGADCHLVLSKGEQADPSPWSFTGGDGLRFAWTNPASVKWGIEVGYQSI